MSKDPIFIHSLFRTGSTYIWNKFRQNDRFYCYYEPFHQGLSQLTVDNIEDLLTKDFEAVNHPPLTRYYLYEYKPLLKSMHTGAPYFKKSFSFDEFCYIKENQDLERYIDYLLTGTGDKIPVLQFNRSSLRIKWFKKYYPNSLNIYLVRNPRDQWQSYFEVLRKANENIFFLMDILTASINARTECFEKLSGCLPLIDFHNDSFNNEIKNYQLIEPCYSLEEKYYIFYYIWLRALIENALNADFLLDMNRLSESVPARKEFEDLIFKYSGIKICYDDANIKRYDNFPLSRDVMTDIEADVQQSIFYSLGKNQLRRFFKRLEREGNSHIPVNPLETPGIKETRRFSFTSRDAAEKLKQMVLDFAGHYLYQEERNRLLVRQIQEFEKAFAAESKQVERLEKQSQEIDEDRAAKLSQIDTLKKRLSESNADRAARLEQVNVLVRQLQESNADRVARLEQIKMLSKLLQGSNADRATILEQVKVLNSQEQTCDADYLEKLQEIKTLRSLLQKSDADSTSRLEQIRDLSNQLQASNKGFSTMVGKIKKLSLQLERLQSEQKEKLSELGVLKKRLKETDEDLVVKEEIIKNMESQLTQVQSNFEINIQEKERLELKVQDQQRKLIKIQDSLSWKLISSFRGIKNGLKSVYRKTNNDSKSKIKIAIDVTPVLPGGDNGGIKLLLWELLKSFNHNSGNEKFILLTSSKNDYLFNEFKMKRICVLKAPIPGRSQLNTRIANRIKKRFKFLSGKGLLKRNGTTVLFCPFAAPTYSEIGIPTVSVVADLQHLYYPFFFSKNELKNRNHFYERLRAKADYIIAISEFTRKTIIKKLNFPPENVHTIPISIQSRLQAPPPASIQIVLENYALYNRKYCIYPANLWPHKNHKILIAAFAMFLKKYPAYDLHLVFTGAPIGNNGILNDSIKQMGIDNRVHFTGFLPGEELAMIWSQAYFLIYPSLFEGFGIPLVEAMRYKKPILASNVASIPEVAGEAAIYFNPKKPDDIVDTIHKIMKDRSLYDFIAEKGQEQLKKYNIDEMMDKYIEVLHKASNNRKLLSQIEFSGIFSDGWAGEAIQISFNKHKGKRLLELKGFLPQWLPINEMEVKLRKNFKLSHYLFSKGRELHLKEQLPQKSGKLDITPSKSFIPQNGDRRKLSFLVRELSVYDQLTGEKLYKLEISK